MVSQRSAEDIKQQASSLTCQVLEINATLPVEEILGRISGYYRLVEGYKFAETSEERALQIESLHKIYEMEVL